MNPRVELKQEAVASDDASVSIYPRPAKRACIMIDGIHFFSDTPDCDREAIEINHAARRLVERMKQM